MNKRGFEIAVSTIVWLTITLIIFSGSIYFINKFFTTAIGFEKQIDADTRKNIENLIKDGKVVVIPINKKTVARGTGATYWLGVQNTFTRQQQFTVTVDCGKAFDFRERPIGTADPGYINSKWVLMDKTPLEIPQGASRDIPIYIQAGDRMSDSDTTQKGYYVFNVCVFNSTRTDCTAKQVKATPDAFYTKRLYKLVVEVP